jgi:serine/threonine-protein kinase
MSDSAPELDAMIGRTLGGKYRLLRVIGRGGMGTVFEAENVSIGKRFAVKLLDQECAKDAGVVGRFAREARAASAVESEHIVSVVDAGVADNCPYIAMELLRGEDIGTRLRRDARVPLRETLHIAAQVLRGLAAAHGAGIVHRDLKPDNVLLIDHAGDPTFVKIVDFGISKVERPRGGTAPLAITQRGVILGTPLYMAPEQARSLPDVDGRADLFSVGAIVFECLSGRPPHVGETYEQILLSLCMEDAPDVRAYAADVPADVAAFIARALARDRAERFSSAVEMLSALRALAPDDPAVRPLSGELRRPMPSESEVRTVRISGGPSTEAPWTSFEPPASQVRRVRARAAAIAIMATLGGVAAATGILAVQRGRSERPTATASAPLSSSSGTQSAPPAGPSSIEIASSASSPFAGQQRDAPVPPRPGHVLKAGANPASGGASPPRPSSMPAHGATASSASGLDIQRELP